MGAREDSVKLLRSGLTPGQISRHRRVSLKTTLGYLDEMVGRGMIRRSDIFFSVTPEVRRQVATVLKPRLATTKQAVRARLERRGFSIDEDDLEVVLRYGNARHALGDMYEDLRTVEVGLHRVVRSGLEVKYGRGDRRWWKLGVPRTIRTKCEKRFHDDPESPAHPYAYTDILDLRGLLDKHWQDLSPHVCRDGNADRSGLLRDLERLNRIRRIVMHPVRGRVPSEADFEFLRDVKRRLRFG
jgi:hypothetical protein